MKIRKILAIVAATMAYGAFASHHVMFLHGWNSDGDIWGKMRSLMESDAGYDASELHAISYYGSAFGYSKSTPIQTVAEGVAREITEIYYESGEKPVDIVAHSMGGLIVRAMLAYDLIDAKCIGSFVSLATPHYGQNIDIVGKQTEQMKYASSFLWNLADAWHFQGLSIPDTLCIAGSYATKNNSRWDGLVHAWSAALADKPCRYVKKCHSPLVSDDAKTGTGIGAIIGGALSGGILGAIIGGIIGNQASEPTDSIYQCAKGVNDDVYVLVSEFLADGKICDQESLSYATLPSSITSKGGMFYQIVDETNAPAVFSSSDASLVHTFWHIENDKRVIAEYLEHGVSDLSSQKIGVELVYGTMPAGTYELTARESKTTPAFTAGPLSVEGGRMTIARLCCDGTVIAAPKETPAVPEPTTTPDPTPTPDPFDPSEPALYAKVTGSPNLAASAVWNGWLMKDGVLQGVIQVKTSKANSRTGDSTVKATITLNGARKQTIKGTPLNTTLSTFSSTLSTSNAQLTFGDTALGGSFGEYTIVGSLQPTYRASAMKSDIQTERISKLSTGAIGVAWDGGVLSATIKKRGKVTVSGILADGTKITATSQVVVGEAWCAIPISWAKKGHSVTALLWVCIADPSVAPIAEGLGDAEADWVATPAPQLAFSLAGSFAVDGLVTSLIPTDYAFSGGNKWAFPKADTIKLDANTHQPVITKDNGNPSAMRLSYKPASGAITGSFKAYAIQNGKLKKLKATVNGITAGGWGFGFATIRGVAPVPFVIAPGK